MNSDSDMTMSDWENAGESEDWELEGSEDLEEEGSEDMEVESSEMEEEEEEEECAKGKEKVESREEEEDEEMEGECSKGKEKVEGKDRISELPDALVEDILSYMPMMDAIKTSILSERWRWSWASTTKIEFLFEEFNDTLDMFSEFITSTMMLNRSSTIHKFVLRSYFDAFMSPAINFCLRQLVRKRVEELCLDLDFCSEPPLAYWLTPEIYYCESVKKLSFTCCQVSPMVAVNWRSLQDLSIENAFIDNQTIQMILCGSPHLESLLLRNCGGFNHIDSTTLTRLVIGCYGNEPDSNSCLEINAPNLHSLELTGCMRIKLQSLRNLLSALLTVSLSFSLDDDDINPDTAIDNNVNVDGIYQDMVTGLLNIIRPVMYLTLGTWLIQALSALELQKFPPPFLQCKHLKLDIDLYEEEFPGINSLLRSSPNLEKLVVDLSCYHDNEEYEGGPGEIWNFDANNYWESKKLLSKCLKTVEFIGYNENVPEFAKFLLQQAKGLETMTFSKSKGNNDDDRQRPDSGLAKAKISLE
ncbi:putative F-box/LRR-repeat protein At3g18150 [Chenopodium quinoa]|uniref:putative F-box/LRR-repeat protein At3g18150 n=1 Tax=Chenopodium quinoa TaxID=63459 RepID=UPI000B79007E|nr:putative F-box/LRR-repeat protein At3g18150 [Chenopodium quinoa]